MTDIDLAPPPGQADRYREMASRIRTLTSLVQYAEIREQLSLLALQYERLAKS